MPGGLSISGAPPLSKLTTIGLGGQPIARAVVEEAGGFEALPAALERLGGHAAVLGRGSNILPRDGELPLVLVELGKAFVCREPEVLRDDAGGVTVSAGAATPLPYFISRLAAMGLGGFAGLSGIPGLLGGAVAMNAGSFGDEIKNCLTGVSLFSPALGRVELKAGDLDVSYRHFGIPLLAGVTDLGRSWFIIDRAEFCCPKAAPELLRARAREFASRKRLTQPMGDASAGCIFKNHATGPAGRLLEEAGLKGRAIGGMSFSTKHANFLINNGTGTAAQAFELIDCARDLVEERCGACLELEVRIWP